MQAHTDPAPGPSVLVVEDEPAIADAVAYALAAEGFTVSVAPDGESALRLQLDDVDVAVLDLMLPGLSGVEVCRRIRARSAVPILMLTARTAEIDRVIGLEAGADDYLGKPFSMAELVARIRAMLRRRALDRKEAAEPRVRVGGLELDLPAQSVVVDGRRVEVTQSEFRLLALLAREPGRPFSRREIVERLWRSTYVGDERICNTHVKNLRRKIESDPAHPQRLVTVRGVGYMLRAG